MAKEITKYQAQAVAVHMQMFMSDNTLKDRSEYTIDGLQNTYHLDVAQATHLYNSIQVQMKIDLMSQNN